MDSTKCVATWLVLIPRESLPLGFFRQCHCLARFALGPERRFYAHVFASAGRFRAFLACSGSFQAVSCSGRWRGFLARCPVPLSSGSGLAAWFALAGVRCLHSRRRFAVRHHARRAFGLLAGLWVTAAGCLIGGRHGGRFLGWVETERGAHKRFIPSCGIGPEQRPYVSRWALFGGDALSLARKSFRSTMIFMGVGYRRTKLAFGGLVPAYVPI